MVNVFEKICQSGKISPNLVTLVTIKKYDVEERFINFENVWASGSNGGGSLKIGRDFVTTT